MADKATTLTKAGEYPLRHNKREAKVIETAEAFTPTTPSDFTGSPTAQDAALDELANRMTAAEAISGTNQTKFALIETDFSSTTAPTASDLDTGVTLPDNAVVVAVHGNVKANDSGANNDGSLSLLVGDGGTLIAAVTADDVDNIFPGAATTKTTAATNLFWSAATRDIDQGNAKVLVEYFIGLA